MIDVANQNLEMLTQNPYPGRGIIIGMDEAGENLVQVYWIMGRSPNSRNRVFETDGSRLWTEAADPSKVEDPRLIIYNAMLELRELFVVSNGDQTDTIYQALLAGGDFCHALNIRQYEPDAPNFTPRISGLASLRHGVPTAELSVLKKSDLGDGCDRHFFHIEQFGMGYGHCVTTYMEDGDPLPPFEGQPYPLPLLGKIDAVARTTWNALNAENRVSLAAKFINIETAQTEVRVINQYEKIATEA